MAASGPALENFAEQLRKLYEAAGKPVQDRLLQLDSEKISKSSLNDWLRGRSAPSLKKASYFLALVRYLNAKAQQRPGYTPLPTGQWGRLLEAARAENDRNRGGRPSRPASPRRPVRRTDDAAQQHRSRVLADHFAWVDQYVRSAALLEREEELRELEDFCDGQSERAYVWWQAGPWAGKSALMAEFASRQPAGADVVSYFIGERFGNNDRESFVRRMNQQLAAVAGQDPAQAGAGPQEFAGLCNAAAEACRRQGRRLIVVVDGLDEDGGADPGGNSIAALLPKHPPADMRVIVTGRPHPLLPSDLPHDHPLRQSDIVRPLSPSPRAQVISDMAERELEQLLNDTPVGSDLLGVLVAARGALSDRDLSEVLDVRPHDVRKRLRRITGRSFLVDERRHFARPQPTADPRRYLLGHEELRRTALAELGSSVLGACADRLHTWADAYQAKGWPPGTPAYLLYDYPRMLRRAGSAQRIVSLALDPRRQLALVARSSVDTALANLEMARQLIKDNGAGDVGVLAALAASRDLLHQDARALPPSLPVAFAALGHSQRAIDLARSAPYVSDRAARLAQVAQTLAASDHQHAIEAAQEAARWAQQARHEASPQNGDQYDAEAATGQAAVALLAVGQRDEGRTLLKSLSPPAGDGDEILTCSTAVQASLAVAHGDVSLAEELLDVAERYAEQLASGWAADPAAPIRAWTVVAQAASPPRTARLEERISQYAQTRDEKLEACAVRAVAASALAKHHPDEAAALAQHATRRLRATLLSPESLSREDTSHLHIFLESMLESVVQALVDTGAADEAHKLVTDVPVALHTGWFGRDVRTAALALLSDPSTEVPHTTENLARQACDLSGQGRQDEAESRLQEALALLASSPGSGRVWETWLITLCAALASVGETADAQRLAEDLEDPGCQVRALAAVAVSEAVSGRVQDAHRLARTAADHARALEDADNFAILDGSPGVWVAAAKRAAAQALAYAGDRDGALALAKEVGKEHSPRRRRTLIAVAAGLRAHDSATATRLIEQERKHVMATPTDSSSRIVRLAELAATIGDAHPASRDQIDEAIESVWSEQRATQQRATLEEILVAVIVASPTQQEEARQVLERSWCNWSDAPPWEIPIDGFAVVFAAFQDYETAHRVAQLHRHPAERAAAFATVAAYLTHAPITQPISDDSTSAFTQTLLNLALLDLPPDPVQAAMQARRFLVDALAGDGWYHVLHVLAQIAPDELRCLRDLVFAHRRLNDPHTAM